MFRRLLATLLVCAATLSCDVQRGAEPPEPEPVRQAERGDAAAPPPPAPRRSLPGKAAAPGSAALDGLERVDLMSGLSTGAITIEVNDPSIQQSVAVLVDGNTDSLAKTDSINPLEITITLPQPIRLRAARAYLAASSYDWALEPAPGADRLVLSAVPERTWSQVDLQEATETSVIRIEAMRLERDDYVHANEIELYAEP
jgi:hypothetical protein